MIHDQLLRSLVALVEDLLDHLVVVVALLLAVVGKLINRRIGNASTHARLLVVSWVV